MEFPKVKIEYEIVIRSGDTSKTAPLRLTQCAEESFTVQIGDRILKYSNEIKAFHALAYIRNELVGKPDVTIVRII